MEQTSKADSSLDNNGNFGSLSQTKSDFVSSSNKPDIVASNKATKQAVFITDENNVRSFPDVKASLIAVPPKGTKCEILEQKDRWYKVKFGSTTGWTNKINIRIQ